ncbi:MAG: aminotransferase class I/II-fold pyridoxal phosphate-dependent enzyme [Planctomycetota bacterium]
MVESTTLAIAARAAAMQAAGIDVVSLSAGEPDFPTPSYVSAAGVRAIETGKTRYTATSGRPDVRKAARTWWHRVYDVDLGDGELIVTAGAKPALLMALMALVEDGDRVLIPAPLWVSYPDLVAVAGGVPVTIPPAPERGFVLDPDTLRAEARAHGARGIILNYPNNPSGAVASPAQMEALLHAAIECGLWVLSDEIYGTLVYEGAQYRSAGSFAFAREHVVLVGGGTKSHTLTGWRIGFLAGPKDIIGAAGRVQSQVLGNPCTISQEAVLAMCSADDGDAQAERRAAFDARRRWVMANVGTLPGWTLQPAPRGAFYALFDVRALCQRLSIDDLGLAQRLLEEAHVALVPGSAFAIPGFVRLSYAAGMDDLKLGAQRIAEFTEKAR